MLITLVILREFNQKNRTKNCTFACLISGIGRELFIMLIKTRSNSIEGPWFWQTDNILMFVTVISVNMSSEPIELE